MSDNVTDIPTQPSVGAIAAEIQQGKKATEPLPPDKRTKPAASPPDPADILPRSKPRPSFQQFIAYWRSLTPEQRSRVMVRVYRLFPVIDLRWADEKAHTYIDKIAGERPLGGEGDDYQTAADAILANYGCGDYHLIMTVDAVRGSTFKQVCTTQYMGYTDNYPGFRDFNKYPPRIADPRCIKLEDPKNVKSGYIAFMQGIGALRLADAVQGKTGTDAETAQRQQREDDMEATAGAKAVEVLGTIASQVVMDRQQDRQQAAATAAQVPAATSAEWATIEKTISTVNKIHAENTVNPVELMRATAEMMRPPAPPDMSPVMAQMGEMMRTITTLQEARAQDLVRQVDKAHDMMQNVVAQLRRDPPVVQRADDGPADGLDELLEMEERRKKIRMLYGVEDDDRPRRRRRYEDEDEDGNPRQQQPGLLERLLPALPALVTSGLALFGHIRDTMQMQAVLAHNAAVARTGQGELMPVPSPTAAAAPVMTPAAYYNPPPVQPLQPTPMQPQSQSQPQGGDMNQLIMFMRTIEPGLLYAFEHNETGYEYAETFIKSQGRMVYQMVLSQGDAAVPMPDRVVNVLYAALQQYPPLWDKLGPLPGLKQFLAEFAAYDMLLQQEETQSITQLLADSGYHSLREYFNAPLEEGDGDGQDELPDTAAAPVVINAAAPADGKPPKKKRPAQVVLPVPPESSNGPMQ